MRLNHYTIICYFLRNAHKARDVYYLAESWPLPKESFLVKSDYERDNKKRAKEIKKHGKKSIELLDIIVDGSYKISSKISQKDLYRNQALVMLVSAFETFMKDLFILMINKNKLIQNKILSSSRKISFSIFKEYNARKTTLGEIIAKKYSFQKIESVIQIYKTILDIDLNKFIEQINKERGKGFNTVREVEKIVKKRNRIIHEAHTFTRLTHKDLEFIFYLFSDIVWNVYLHTLLNEFLKKQGKKPLEL